MNRISDSLRREISLRAGGQCEYCRLQQAYSYSDFEIDHIYAVKHGGETNSANLCLSCLDCNRFKGSDLCSIDPLTQEIVTLYHPLQHTWSDHFKLSDAMIAPVTSHGRVTVRILRLNDLYRLKERERLIKLNRYP